MDIETLAKEAGFEVESFGIFSGANGAGAIDAKLARFAELVEAVTREDCALTCQALLVVNNSVVDRGPMSCAAAIRALK